MQVVNSGRRVRKPLDAALDTKKLAREALYISKKTSFYCKSCLRVSGAACPLHQDNMTIHIAFGYRFKKVFFGAQCGGWGFLLKQRHLLVGVCVI